MSSTTSATSWVMFLGYLDELEQQKADEAALRGHEYKFIIDEEYRWAKRNPEDKEAKEY